MRATGFHARNYIPNNNNRNKTMRKLVLFFVSFLLLPSLGCGVSKMLGFGEAEINLQPSEIMNIGENGNPLPTVIWIYQLKSKDRMEKADFKTIWRSDKEILDDDLLEKKEIMIYPGKNQEIELEKKDNTRYIAIIAIFRKPNEETGKWKQIIDADSWTIGSQKIDVIVGKDVLKLDVLEDEKDK
jgi:type VI secretion system protein VasD